ncbi:hypothetical protein Tco_0869379 [Tanacetum coccineum]
MDVDHDQKTSCGSDVNAKNGVNKSMDVDHDPKALEQQHMTGKNLIDEEEQQVASMHLINDEALEQQDVAGKNLINGKDQQVASKNLKVPLEGEELVVV